jgi:hypothetical protein
MSKIYQDFANINLTVSQHKDFRNIIPFALLNAYHGNLNRTIYLENGKYYVASGCKVGIKYSSTSGWYIPTLGKPFTWSKPTGEYLMQIGVDGDTDYTTTPIAWAQIEEVASLTDTATAFTRNKTDYTTEVKNLFAKPLAVSAEFMEDGNNGDKSDYSTSELFGRVQHVNGTGGNLCLKVIPDAVTVDEEVTLFVIAKSTGGTLWQFGWYDVKDTINKWDCLSTSNAKTIELGDDWYIYYKNILSTTDLNTAAAEGNFGLNTVVGDWDIASFGLVYGGVPPFEAIVGDLNGANDRETGIYIKDRKIAARTDQFYILSNSGTEIAAFYIGADGKPYLDAGFIKAQSVSAWILMQPFQDFSNISEFRKGQSFSWRIKGLTAETDFGVFSTFKTGVIINIWNTSSYNAKFLCSVIDRGRTLTKFGTYTVYVPPYCLMHAVSVPNGTIDSDTGLENVSWNLLCPHTISQAIIYITGFN